jgi:hypothetical protein
MRISFYANFTVVMENVFVSNKVRLMVYDTAIVFWLQVLRSSARVWLGNVWSTVRVPMAVHVKGLWWTAQLEDWRRYLRTYQCTQQSCEFCLKCHLICCLCHTGWMDGWIEWVGKKAKWRLIKACVKRVQVGPATLMLDVGFKVSTVVNGLVVRA